MDERADTPHMAGSAPAWATGAVPDAPVGRHAGMAQATRTGGEPGAPPGHERPTQADGAATGAPPVEDADPPRPDDAAASQDAAAPDHATTDVPRPDAATVEAEPPADTAPGHLTIIGTGHVFRIEQTIQDAIEAIRPAVVFVELDQGRLQALLYKKRTGQRPAGRGGFVHKRLQRFQEGVAGLYGGEVGSEMIAAVEAAQRVGARVALIDAPADQTLKKALRQLTIRERLRAVGLLIKAGFQQLLPRRSDAKETMDEEIRKYQEDPQAALDEMKRLFPTVHRVIIHDRDVAMSEAVRGGLRHGDGVAVVGDGHVEGMLKLLDDVDVTAYRLAAVREGSLPVPPGRVAQGDAQDVGYGFEASFDAP